jgi:hypothetical protein
MDTEQGNEPTHIVLEVQDGEIGSSSEFEAEGDNS